MDSLTPHQTTVSDLTSQSFIQRALTSPGQSESILSFFFGVDYRNAEDVQVSMIQGQCMHSMVHLWFQGGSEYDEFCKSFCETITRLKTESNWPSTNTDESEGSPTLSEVDHWAARLILADQLPRNAFRGSSEAFAYEEYSLDAFHKLSTTIMGDDDEMELKGEVYPPYMFFAFVAGIHSEDLADHEHVARLIEYVRPATPAELAPCWNQVSEEARTHKAVVDRFGRYPQRNRAKGRENTKEEEAWLADVENLPRWARSQGCTEKSKCEEHK